MQAGDLQGRMQRAAEGRVRPARTPRRPARGSREALGRRVEAPGLAEALARARRIQAQWAALEVRQRSALVRRMGTVIAERTDEIVETVSKLTGKTRVDALSTEVVPAVAATSWYARIAPRVLAPRRLRRSSILFVNKVTWETRVPYGVVGIISPWNYPFGIPIHDVAAALLAGNAVLLKVASSVEPVGELIVELAKQAGIPGDLLHHVRLPGPAALEAMLANGVDRLTFTGSTEAGREVMRKAAGALVPVTLELGGNDAMIVLADANLGRAAAGVLWAGASNAGQSCAGVKRIFVEQGAWDGFRQQLARMVHRLRVGPGAAYDVDVGSMASMEAKQRIAAMVQEALTGGARVVAQSGPPTGMFHPVIVLENVDDSMRVMREEVFGPVICLVKVRDEEEAVGRANDSPYGLTASVWTESTERALRVASRLAVGTVTINDHLMSHAMPEAPWGGFKSSGIGRTHGEEGLRAMSQIRVVVHDRLHRTPRAMWWHPHDQALHDGLAGAVVFLRGRGLGRRLVGLAKLIRTFMRGFTPGYREEGIGRRKP